MKFKKRKFVSTIGAIALAGIVVVPTLALTSCSGGSSTPTPATTFTIYGGSTINGIAGLSSTSSYSAVDNNGNDVTNNST
jgi:hypothetical protein